MILHYVCRDERGWRGSASREIPGELPLGEIIGLLPDDAEFFYVAEPAADPEVPAALVLPRHFLLRGDRAHLKPVSLGARLHLEHGRKLPPYSHLLPHDFGDQPELVIGGKVLGGDALFASERIVRVAHGSWYRLENLDGDMLDENRIVTPAP